MKWNGHWQKGAGLTSGEEEEQVNAFATRLSTSKYMGKGSRTDFLTLRYYAKNIKGENRMAKNLVVRRNRVLLQN